MVRTDCGDCGGLSGGGIDCGVSWCCQLQYQLVLSIGGVNYGVNCGVNCSVNECVVDERKLARCARNLQNLSMSWILAV